MKYVISSVFRAAFILALGAAVLVQAQVVDPPVGVAVKVWANGIVNDSSGGDVSLWGDFLPSTPGGTDGSASAYDSEGYGNVATAVLGSKGYIRVEPAKTYLLNMSSTNLNSAAVNIVAPPGFRVVMDNMLRSREQVYGGAIMFQLLPLGASHPGLAGLASSISSLNIDWRVSLGSLMNGSSAGDLALVDTGTRSDWTPIASPSSLYYEPVNSEINVYRPNNVIRQVKANQVFVDIVPLPANAPTYFEIRCYNPSQAVKNDPNMYVSFPYTFTGQPYVTYRVQLGSNSTSLKITREVINVVDATTTTLPVARREIMTLTRTGTWPNVTWTKTDWTLENQSPVNEVDVASTGDGVTRSESIAVKATNGATAMNLTRSYTTPMDANNVTTIGEVLSAETAGHTTLSPLSSGFDYYTDTSQWGSLGFLKSATLPGHAWVAYDYYLGDITQGQPAGEVRYAYKPYGTGPDTISRDPTSGDVTYYEYTNDLFGAPTRPSLVQRTINGTVVSKTTYSYNDGAIGTAATRTDYADATHSTTTTTTTDRADDLNDFMRGMPVSSVNADGSSETISYMRGFWDGSVFHSNWSPVNQSEVAVYHGYGGGNYVAGKSTYETTIRDSRALVIRTELYVNVDGGGTWALVSYTNYTYDFAGRLTQRVSSNGATYTATYDGGLKTSETDESGVTTTYTYDAGDRVATATRVGVGAIPSVTTSYTYDALGHQLRADYGSGQSEVITTQASYDDAGRIVTETPPGGFGAVTHSYDVDNRIETVTNADGGTSITTTNIDGSVASVTGTAVVAAYHTYGVEPDGRQWDQVNSGAPGSPRWQKTWADWMGRTIETDTPGFTGQPTVVSTSTYDSVAGHTSTGHVIKTTKTGVAPTLYQYDPLGNVSRSGLDYDGNGTLDLASSDRITETETYFENYNSAWWKRTDTRTYPYRGVGTVITTTTARTRISGFPANRLSETQAIDAEGNLTTQTLDVNRGAATAVATTTRTGITGSMTENSVDGFSVSVTGFDGLQTTKAYDSLLRPHSITDSRNNTTTTAYVAGTNMVQTVTDANGDVSVTGYDAVGRVNSRRDPRNYYTYLSFNQRGQLVHQWGGGTMPVEYGYDSTYGDKLTMSTFRGGAGWDTATWPSNPGAADTTTWTYDAPSGLLTAKMDAAGKSVTQSYNERGQTSVRTLARGVSTTYTYDGATGELINQSYSDSTPAVTYSYGRTGQIESVSDVTGYRDLVYDATKPWRLTAEVESDFYGGRVMTRLYDNTTMQGRITGFEVGTAPGSNADLEQDFGYATNGRFSTITSTRNGESATSHTFRYGYLSNAALLQSLSLDNSSFSITRGYETTRDLVTSFTGQWGTTIHTQYTYTYDERGQRKSVVQSGDAFGDYGDSTFRLFSYDGRGEVIGDVGYVGSNTTDQSKPMPGRHYGFAYDNAENRQWSDRTGVDLNGDGLPDLRDNYTTNGLNQYVSRENNTVPVSGTAAPDTSPAGGAGGTAVAIKGRTVPAGRQSRYWNDEITVPNTLNPWRGPVTIFTAMRGTTGSPDLYRVDTRMVQMAAQTQSLTYDDDGNLIHDGITDYTWDAENRLIRLETNAIAVSNYGFPHRLIEFEYDYLGRRVQKRVVDVDQNTELYCRRYLYDGWNLIAEYLAPGGTTVGSLVRSYTWGLDIATDLQKAGGVGALLQIADHGSGKTYLPTYDGNGNVVSLINASTGAVAAVYEYSPYGETLRADVNDPTVADNPWRFSTKYYDADAGLYYYGRRYYSPSLGRFIGRDPSAESGGLHLYAFCLNNPINLWDVLGNYPDFGAGSFVSGGNVYSTNANGQVYFNYGATVYGLHQFVDPTLSANPLNSFQLAGFGSGGSTVALVNGGGTTDGVYVDSAVDPVTGVPYTSPFYTVTYTSSRVSLGSLTMGYGGGGGGGGWSPSITLPSWMYQNRGSNSNPQNTTMAGLRDDITTALQGIDSLTGKTHFFSDSAIALLLGTAAQESQGLQYRTQQNGGPARGLFQMEKATYDDIWSNYLNKNPTVADAIKAIFTPAGGSLSFDMLQGNDGYAAVMARMRYAAYTSDPLPDPSDVAGLADYWKTYYNTPAGKGTPGQFINSFNTYVAPVLSPPPNNDGGGGGG